ncbi:MAG: NAD(P)/FAD-dependent oxidoreductase, partial [Anaerolineae bacterium]
MSSRDGPRIAVIGAGPAGIMAALEASAAGAQTTLYDTNAAVGRKL